MTELDQQEKQQLRESVNALCDEELASCTVRMDGAILDLLSGGSDVREKEVEARRSQLELVGTMIRDKDWELPRLDKRRIGCTIAYLAERPEESFTRVFDLMFNDCRMELQMYQEFSEFRDAMEESAASSKASRSDWLKHKREGVAAGSKKRFLGMRRSRIFRRKHAA